jgi:hypothetical protein
MMKPRFQRLVQGYPRTIMREALFAEIGWNDLIPNKAFLDTCAIRMSYGLLQAGIELPGARMKVNAGALKGHFIEPGQAKLSIILKRIWGTPEVYVGERMARAGIGSRTGVVSFYRISGDDGGHIDLIWTAPGSMFQDCARSCYFSAVTVWFWPLK